VSADRYIKGIEVGIAVEIVGEAMCSDLGIVAMRYTVKVSNGDHNGRNFEF
jgi:hypothetical protein